MKSTVPGVITRFAIAALAGVLVFAPATGEAKDKKDQKQTAPDPSPLAWPPPPLVARLRFLGQYVGDDIVPKKKKGWLEKAAGVQVREDRNAMIKPYGVAVDSKGRAYVADTDRRLIFVFDLEQKKLEFRGNKGVGFRIPIGVAIDRSDRLYVSDAAAHTITVFTPEGETEAMFGTDDLQRPVGLAIDSELNRLYVADAKARQVVVFDLQSRSVISKIGTPAKEGEPPLEATLLSPSGVAVDPDGLLYVVDTFANTVKIFDPDGEPVRSIGSIGTGAGQFARPRGIAFDSDGHMYVVDAMTNTVQLFTADGRPLMPIGGLGAAPGKFAVPADVTIDRQNRVFVTDQLNGRVQVFQYVTDAEVETLRAKQAGAPSASQGAANTPLQRTGDH